MPRVAFLTLFVLLASACTAHVFSPPAGSFMLDTSATLGEGRTSVRGDSFFGGAIFGPDISSHRVTVTHGLRDKLDLVVAPAFTYIHSRAAGDSPGGIYGLRGGVKYAPVRHFALTGGLGMGGSAGGAFLSPHLGFIGAWENDYAVPFVSYTLLLSAPIARRSVQFGVGEDTDALGDRDPDPLRVRMTPEMTYGWQSSLGLRLWLGFDPNVAVRPSLLCGVGGTTLFDRYGFGEREVYIGFSCGVDVHFKRVSFN